MNTNKKESKENIKIWNTNTFQKYPISKNIVKIQISKSQSSLLSFKKDLNNLLDINISTPNNLKLSYNKNTKIKSQGSTLIKEIQNYKGRKSSNYVGIILK